MYRFYDHCCENIILKILQIIYFNTDMKAQGHVHVCSFVVLPSYWILGCILIVLWPTRNKEFSQYMCYIKGLKSTILNIYLTILNNKRKFQVVKTYKNFGSQEILKTWVDCYFYYRTCYKDNPNVQPAWQFIRRWMALN